MQTKQFIACNLIDSQNALIPYSYYKKIYIQRSNMMLYLSWDWTPKKMTVGRASFTKFTRQAFSILREESKDSVPKFMIANVSLWLRPWSHNCFLKLSVSHGHFLLSKNTVYTTEKRNLSITFLRTCGKHR